MHTDMTEMGLRQHSLWTLEVLQDACELDAALAFLTNTSELSLNAPDIENNVKRVPDYFNRRQMITSDKNYKVSTYLTSSLISSNMTTSSTQNTAQARAIWPARYVRSSGDWALSITEPGRATLNVYDRPDTTKQIKKL